MSFFFVLRHFCLAGQYSCVLYTRTASHTHTRAHAYTRTHAYTHFHHRHALPGERRHVADNQSSRPWASVSSCSLSAISLAPDPRLQRVCVRCPIVMDRFHVRRVCAPLACGFVRSAFVRPCVWSIVVKSVSHVPYTYNIQCSTRDAKYSRW